MADQQTRLILSPDEIAALRQSGKVVEADEYNPQQIKVLTSLADVIFYAGSRWGGKAQPLTEPVMTSSGWTTMGELKPGSRVIGSSGKPVTVTAVWPQGKKAIVKVTMSDGSWTRCSWDHLWTGAWGNDRAGTKTIREIYNEWELKKSQGQSFHIPVPKPVQWNRRTIPVDPYVVGALIGDGSLSTDPRLSSADEQIVREVAKGLGMRTLEKIPSAKYEYHIPRYEMNGVLEVMGKRSWEKYIPEKYLWASVDERWALLQGLMDTDGYCDDRAHCSFTTVSERLAWQVRELVLGLGGVATVTSKKTSFTYKGQKKVGRTAFNVWINVPDLAMLFRLKRKKDRCANRIKKLPLYRYIKLIEPDGMEECQCISVSARDGLYLTREFIVTHNTFSGQRWILSGNPDKPNYDENGKPILVNQSYCYHPAFQAAVIRKNEQDLEEWVAQVVPLVQDMGGKPLKNPWRFEFDGVAKIYLGHFESEKSWEAFQGKNLIRLLIEEGGQMATRQKFELLRSSVRSVWPDMRAQTLMNANPIGPGLAWLYDFFIEPKDDKTNELLINPHTGKPYQPEEIIETFPSAEVLGPAIMQLFKGREEKLKYTRVWIPSYLTDNPKALNDPGYIASLASMEDEKTVKAFLHGDWKAFKGKYFPFSKEHHVRKPEEIQISPWAAGWGSLDIGFTHRAAAYDYRREPSTGQTFVVKELSVDGLDPIEVGYEMAHMYRDKLLQQGHFIIWLSHDALAYKTGSYTQGHMLFDGFKKVIGAKGVYFPELMLKEMKRRYEEEEKIWTPEMSAQVQMTAEKGFTLRIAPRDRVTGWQLIRSMLRTKQLGELALTPDPEVALQINRESGYDAMVRYFESFRRPQEILPKLIVSSDCQHLIDAFPRADHDTTNVEDMTRKHFTGADNLDSLRYGLMGARDLESMPEPFESRRQRLVAAAKLSNPQWTLREIVNYSDYLVQQEKSNEPGRVVLRIGY